MARIYSFDPIEAKDPIVLILGTIPGRDSLLKKEYYGHTRNCFWKGLFAFFDQPYTTTYHIKKDLVLNNQDHTLGCIAIL